MTEPTWSYVRCRRRDAGRFQRFGYERHLTEGDVAQLYDSDANFGNCDALAKIASARIPFYAWHGSGFSYGPAAQASLNGRLIDVAADESGEPVVHVLDDGTVNSAELMRVRKYLAALRRVRDAIGEGETGDA